MRLIPLFALVLLAACNDGGPADEDTDTTADTDTDTSADTDAVTSFACEELTCDGGDYCEITVGGPQPEEGDDGITPSCLPVPAACEADPSCACFAREDLCPTEYGDCIDGGGYVECTLSLP